ncbi:hypothetical protein [Desulfoluna butyratoxydans]|uniref:DUF2269 domain-containing protein n=1 Tax=Desulfoluna butyratoxydans TaxID=231438 RepID=A0A4U8YKK8_9BACT|nr:hypothetical protein [Desulfoluna butyratoxydans]VFQ44415.1 hypothetical protein MSL71_20640 [Desulfoluna butyratoxydans]
MKTMSRSQQNMLKAVHLIAAGLWLSSVIIIAVMPYVSKGISSGEALYMYNLIFHFIDMKILTPAAVVTLITGLLYSLFTRWGFFKHGWLIYKWAATLAIILSGTFYLGPMVTQSMVISELKGMAALQDPVYLHGLTVGAWAAGINTLLLGLAVVFSIYKPWKKKNG